MEGLCSQPLQFALIQPEDQKQLDLIKSHKNVTIFFIKRRKKRYAYLEGWGGTYNNEKVPINNANIIKRKFIMTDNDNVSLWQTAAI